MTATTTTTTNDANKKVYGFHVDGIHDVLVIIIFLLVPFAK